MGASPDPSSKPQMRVGKRDWREALQQRGASAQVGQAFLVGGPRGSGGAEGVRSSASTNCGSRCPGRRQIPQPVSVSCGLCPEMGKGGSQKVGTGEGFGARSAAVREEKRESVISRKQ